MSVTLSPEQQKFVDWGVVGTNILVDACIGSGKTTSIQALCDVLAPTKCVLYLTYNRLLKLDAKEKIIHIGQGLVTNYHGFAFVQLKKNGINVGFNDIMPTYLKVRPPVPHFDVLIIDEYQDIDAHIAKMLWHIKKFNPYMQIIAVGDMDQKIYDNTKFNANEFIVEFLGENYRPMEFTRCFRLNDAWARQLGDVWEKQIYGVNADCDVQIMDFDEAYNYVALNCEPSDLLCLGSKAGLMTSFLNKLEDEYGDVFNKYTVWSKISDKDGSVTQPSLENAVFTTYDGSKGMERNVCVLFDWTKDYWQTRLRLSQFGFDIIRNIFCVAASRGKKKIIIVKHGRSEMLTFDMIKTSALTECEPQDKFNMSDMFDYKYIEDVEECYDMLSLKPVKGIAGEIHAKMFDGLIDLSPCIGNYQEAMFFDNYDLDYAVAHAIKNGYGDLIEKHNTSGWSVFGKVLYLTSVETNQARYVSQVPWDFVPDEISRQIYQRLSTVFSTDEIVQKECVIDVDAEDYGPIRLSGICDVLKDNVVYELKFVSSLSHTHFLQCACYMLAMDLEKGRLWNVRTNEMWEITIPDRKGLLKKIVETVTKGQSSGVRFGSEKDLVRNFMARHPAECREFSQECFDREQDGKPQVSPLEAREMMACHNLALPVSARQFVRYFRQKKGRY